MSTSSIPDQPRYVFVYRPAGFTEPGGIYRLALDISIRLGHRHCLTLASSHLGTPLSGSLCCTQLLHSDVLLVFGCSSLWAYYIVFRARLGRHKITTFWLPSYHDPLSVKHRIRALIAGLVIRASQYLGVHILAQTSRERYLLRGPSCFLSSHGLHHQLRTSFLIPTPTTTRDIDLIFLGRPTRQKGWEYFLQLVSQTKLSCAAIVPTDPLSDASLLPVPDSLQLFVALSDLDVNNLLHRAKMAIIPADYESFGIAQLEAVAAGCVVPLLGNWPFWEDYKYMNWQSLSLSTLERYCRIICNSLPRRNAFSRSQFYYVQSHPIFSYPWLPGVIA